MIPGDNRSKTPVRRLPQATKSELMRMFYEPGNVDYKLALKYDAGLNLQEGILDT